ncbi:MAG: anti-sigma factor antagonist [Planctomycetota bacterium]|nr:MAG: anti-sigma factor antagonist [Planctomycetota bacterium]
MADFKRTTVTKNGEVAIVRFNDKKLVEGASIEEMGEELMSLVTDQHCHHLLLNFEGVEFLSSAALNKLILLNQKLKDVGGTLRICGLKPDIREVFTLTRLDRLLDIRKTEADALKAFGLA